MPAASDSRRSTGEFGHGQTSSGRPRLRGGHIAGAGAPRSAGRRPWPPRGGGMPARAPPAGAPGPGFPAQAGGGPLPPRPVHPERPALGRPRGAVPAAPARACTNPGWPPSMWGANACTCAAGLIRSPSSPLRPAEGWPPADSRESVTDPVAHRGVTNPNGTGGEVFLHPLEGLVRVSIEEWGRKPRHAPGYPGPSESLPIAEQPCIAPPCTRIDDKEGRGWVMKVMGRAATDPRSSPQALPFPGSGRGSPVRRSAPHLCRSGCRLKLTSRRVAVLWAGPVRAAAGGWRAC